MGTNPGKYSSFSSQHLVAAGVVGAAGIALVLYKYRHKIINGFGLNIFNPLKYQRIQVISTHEECNDAVKVMRRICSQHKVLGFDCEWVTKNGIRHPVALLQLASYDGFCALIRLSKIQHIPTELKVLLEDPSILKVGVAAVDDAKYLYNDYAVKVNGIIDLRHLAVLCSEKPDGLAALAKTHLNVTISKYWRIRCSDWEAQTLDDKQKKYAADDAHVGVEIFKVLINSILKNHYNFNCWFKDSYVKYWKHVVDVCNRFVNVKFIPPKKGIDAKLSDFETLLSKQQRERFDFSNFKIQKRKYSQNVQSKVVYENCYMQTADGETLCTCCRKKAEWYVEKGIADVICEDPFTIQLRFEPAGRSVGVAGEFYRLPRKKKCVVCGSSDAIVKKNVIPKEYRKLFPAIMKDHSCHDVLLMCVDCHQLSNIKDQTMRTHLAKLCNAPITDTEQPKVIEDPLIKKVRSAARALLISSNKHNIPVERRMELEKEILNFFPAAQEITEELLLSACDINFRLENGLYESHGKIVVDYFTNELSGLLELEKLWREHFLESMKPKFMPDYWSVTHTKERLEIRINEGRVEEKDLQIAGLDH